MAFYTQRTAVPLAAGQQLGFTTGRGYYARNAPTGAGATPADPFAPMTPQAIQQTISKLTSGYGQPVTDTQIQARAQSQIDPIIAAITSNVNSHVAGASDAIKGYTADLASKLGQIDYGAPYAGAKQEQAAVDSALQQSLSGGGSQLAQDLSSRLAQIGDPTVAQAAGNVASHGAALGTTELARGSSSLSNLIAQAAAANEYGVKQPGLAREAGIQQIGGVQRQGVSDIADKTASVMDQLPQIVQSLRSANDSLRQNRAQAAAQLFETLTGQNITKATAKAGLVNDNAKLGYDYATAAARNGIAQENADTAKTRATTAANNASKPKGLTADQLAGLQKSAAKDAEDLYHGVTKPNPKDPATPTVVSYTQTYQDALKTLAKRYPKLGRNRILDLVNTWYKPGEYGRPSAQQVAQAEQARVNDAAAALTAGRGKLGLGG